MHGDDFRSEGPGDNLKEMNAQMRKTLSLKTEILGGDKDDVQSVKVFNRQISWKAGEIHWEADPRHVEVFAKHLGLEGASTGKTPRTTRTRLSGTETSRVRRTDWNVRPPVTSTRCS